MAIITPGGTQVTQLPNDYDIAGFSFHSLDNPVTVEVDEYGNPKVTVNAYAVIEVIGSHIEKGVITPISREAVRIENEAYMSAVSASPALYRLLALAMYGVLQDQGYVPKGTVPVDDSDRAIIAEFGKTLIGQYG